MDEFISKVWKLLDLQFPLVITDMETYLVKEGFFTNEDYEKLKSIEKTVKKEYYDGKHSKLVNSIKNGLEQLKSIQPKKPMPPEMKIRFESLVKTMEDLAKSSETN
ncbi:hypothetical protein GWK48_06405 [Metallosphaera tengchongensis]|uniref:Uncharacterized protein n=1 Tax=Metallosphaera tengchongensis TaxID=1532350 RepID=A0A6N0NW21_9CREN|nr:hypothetical protein [Metallosphaera tengchongensis]QKR00053.1 hypothetical protein GWK48_06405 [Metallosphaera tengchongensis]